MVEQPADQLGALVELVVDEPEHDADKGRVDQTEHDEGRGERADQRLAEKRGGTRKGLRLIAQMI